MTFMTYKASQTLADMKSLSKRERVDIWKDLRSWEKNSKDLRKSERDRKCVAFQRIIEECVQKTPGLSLNDRQSSIIRRPLIKRQYIVRYQETDFILDIKGKSISIRCSSSMAGLMRPYSTFDTQAKKNRKTVPISETDGVGQVAPKIFKVIENLYNLKSTSEVVES